MALSKKQQKSRLARLAVGDAVEVMVRFESDPLQRALIDAEGLRALSSLNELRRETDDDKDLAECLRKNVGFDEAGISQIIEGLSSLSSFQSKAISPLTSVPLAEVTTVRLSEENETWIKSEACRQDLTRRVKPSSTPIDPHHEFAPFLEWLSRGDIFPKVKAEALARIDLYIRSGHAAADMSEETPNKNHSETVLKMRQVADRLRRGEKVPEREVALVLENRFEQLFTCVRVQKKDTFEKGTLPLAYAGRGMGFSLFSDDHGSVEGAGIIDAIIPDRENPSQWHMATTTSNDDPTSQGDQICRHTTAVLNSMSLDLPPFPPGSSLASLAFYAPAYLTPNRKKWLAGSVPLSADETSALNAVQIYAQMGCASINRLQVDVTPVLWAHHKTVGAASAAKGGLHRPVSELASEAAQVLSRAAQALAHPDRPLDQEKHGSHFVGPLLDMLVQSARALCTHFPEPAHSGLRAMIPSLHHLAERTDASGFSARAESISDLISRIESIDEATYARSRRNPPRRRPTENDLKPEQQQAIRFQRREAALLDFCASGEHPCSRTSVRRLNACARYACDALWEKVLSGEVTLNATESHFKKGRGVLTLDDDAQEAWLSCEIEKKQARRRSTP